MGRKPASGNTKSCDLRRGAWSGDEDVLLRQCIEKYGEGNWHKVPTRAGLNRCRKSCRLRWLNYLHPGIKRGEFEEDEVDLIKKLHKLLGNRWSLIAGRIPGRTANDIKNYWNTHSKEKMPLPRNNVSPNTVKAIRPQPRSFLSNSTPSKHFIMEKNHVQQEKESSIREKRTAIAQPLETVPYTKRVDEAALRAGELEDLIQICQDDQGMTVPILVPTSSTAEGLTEKLGQHSAWMAEENPFSVDDLVGDVDIWGYFNGDGQLHL